DQPARVQDLARRLGAFNGGWLAEREPPAEPWVARCFRRAQMAEAAAGMARFARSKGDPLVEAGWPGAAFDATLHLWDMRERLLAAYEALPQCLVHGDATDLNLFTTRGAGGEELVAID